MKETQKSYQGGENYQDRRNYQNQSGFNLKTVLDFLNRANTSKEIESILTKNKNISDCIKLSESIIDHRNKLGSFTNIDQLTQIQGFDEQVLFTITSAFEKPTFPIEEEKLQHVMWIHGSSLHVENPEEFGSISKRTYSTRIVGLEDQGVFHESFVHVAIPTPTFSSGNRFFLRAVEVIWRTSLSTHDITHPFVEVLEVEFRDGHQLITNNPPFEITNLGNGYMKTRFNINSNRRINFGIGVSFKQIIEGGTSSNLGWAEYASIGAEFVTRNRIVIDQATASNT